MGGVPVISDSTVGNYDVEKSSKAFPAQIRFKTVLKPAKCPTERTEEETENTFFTAVPKTMKLLKRA